MDSPSSVEAPVLPRMSLAGRLFNVFATPADVFDDVRSTPPTESNWLVPALIVMLLGWLAVGLIFSQESIRYQIREMTEKAVRKQIEKQHMSESQAEQALQAAEKFGDIGIKINAVVSPALIAWLTPFWWGLLMWFGGKFIFKSGFSYMKAVEAAGLANMLMALDTIIRTLLIIVTGNVFASLSPILLLKGYDPENTAHGLLAMLNVMTFWALAARSIGLARLGNTSVGKAAAWVFGIWAGYTGLIFGAGLALRAVFAHIQH